MIKVRILTTCAHCKGQAYLPIGTEHDANGKPYTRHIPCPDCEGSGVAPTWATLPEFAELLRNAQCPHIHTALQGGYHFTAGDVWDDIVEICTDCGVNLDKEKLP